MDFDSSQPIWLQLCEEFSRNIATGIWPEGSRVPGVRDLAAELGVNPNTVQRSLAELDRDGLCRVERASGRFVTDDTDRINQVRRMLGSTAANEFITRAKGLGMELNEASQLIADQWKETGSNG